MAHCTPLGWAVDWHRCTLTLSTSHWPGLPGTGPGPGHCTMRNKVGTSQIFWTQNLGTFTEIWGLFGQINSVLTSRSLYLTHRVARNGGICLGREVPAGVRLCCHGALVSARTRHMATLRPGLGPTCDQGHTCVPASHWSMAASTGL